MTSVLAPAATLPAGDPVRPSSRVHLAVRLVLLAVLAAGAVQAALRPVDRTADELEAALAAGEVATMTIERPTVPTIGGVGVAWTGDGRPGRATYRFDSISDQRVDEGRRLLAAAAASPRDVEVREVDELPSRSSPAWQLYLALAALVALPLTLVVGPEPRLATRWAWFWLAVHAWPVAIAYLALEPTPVWDRRGRTAPERRLTGGWAFLLGLLLGPALLRALAGA
ncbi:hypothetical protein [Cellulomonas sp. Y8]|uniref:hypothetical protein n=1 Tax=Cellulomonas sp. Y8 TaxID=2591145 RepID=UPI003D7210CD